MAAKNWAGSRIREGPRNPVNLLAEVPRSLVPMIWRGSRATKRPGRALGPGQRSCLAARVTVRQARTFELLI